MLRFSSSPPAEGPQSPVILRGSVTPAPPGRASGQDGTSLGQRGDVWDSFLHCTRCCAHQLTWLFLLSTSPGGQDRDGPNSPRPAASVRGPGGPVLSTEGNRTGSSSRGDCVRTPDGPSPGAGTSDPLPQRPAPGPPTPLTWGSRLVSGHSALGCAELRHFLFCQVNLLWLPHIFFQRALPGPLVLGRHQAMLRCLCPGAPILPGAQDGARVHITKPHPQPRDTGPRPLKWEGSLEGEPAASGIHPPSPDSGSLTTCLHEHLGFGPLPTLWVHGLMSRTPRPGSCLHGWVWSKAAGFPITLTLTVGPIRPETPKLFPGQRTGRQRAGVKTLLSPALRGPDTGG